MVISNTSNTYVGTTTINAGTLTLSGNISNTGNTDALVLGGGTLSYTRSGTNTQTFSGTTVNSGYSLVGTTVGTDTIALGAITRTAGGAVNFANTGTVTTTTANNSGILGGYAHFRQRHQHRLCDQREQWRYCR